MNSSTVYFQFKKIIDQNDHDPDYDHQDQYLRFTAGDEEILLDLLERPAYLVHSLPNVQCRYFTGHVVGEQNSKVALSNCGHWSGLIERDGTGVHVLESVHDSSENDHVYYSTHDDAASPFGM